LGFEGAGDGTLDLLSGPAQFFQPVLQKPPIGRATDAL